MVQEQMKVATAHAELLDFFANCSDNEEENKAKKTAATNGNDCNDKRRNTHDYLRKNKSSIDQNEKKKRSFA